MQKIYTTFLLLIGCYVSLLAQKNNPYNNIQRTPSGHIRCLSMEADQYSRAIHPDRGSLQDFEQWLAPRIAEYKRAQAAHPNRMPPILTIPVVVHVIHNGDAIGTGENISDAQVISQIQVLNEDFRRMMGTPGFNNDPDGADVEIEFCLAQTDPNGQPTNGINRVNYGTASFTSNAAVETMKTNTIWTPTEYMNMWSVRFGGGMAGVLGYAQFPDNSGLGGLGANGGAANTDGVVATYTAFGSSDIAPGGTYNAPFDKGRTMTHEVGHWLGLRHIWGDGNCGVDDFCNDTPNSDASNFNCPTGHTSCTSVDMIENYMDYTNDACMNIFTQDQKTRIRTVMSVSPRRMELPNSIKCQPPSPIIAFTNNETNIVEGTDCSYQDIVLSLDISQGATQPATVTFNATGSATGGDVDYAFFPASVTFPAGIVTTQNVTVRVYNDGVVEGVENVIIDFTVSTAGDASATTGDLADHEIIISDDDFAPTPTAQTDILNADFNTGANGFTATGNGGSDRFVLGTAATASSGFWTVSGTNTTQFAYSNDDRCNCNKADDRLITPAFSLNGFTNATLTFDHAFADIPNEVAEVQISTDGGANWTTLQTLTNTSTNNGGGNFTTPWVNGNTLSLNAYLGQNNLLISFRYDDGGGWEYGLAIDNVRIYSNTTTTIQELVNTTNKDSVQVRANETVHWFDPATDNVMGTIENTSSWDYGCTTVEVDRDQPALGGPAAAFWDNIPANYLMAKTFYIDPANNNASGTYNVTFYFTDAEVAAWEAATGKSRNDLKIIKVANNPINAVNPGNYTGYTIEIIPATLGTFGSDITLTANFATGFSGFGFGDPVAPALPVELVNFEANKAQQQVRLNWLTSSETNNDHFIVQRSANGIDFEEFTQVDGAGTTNEETHYQLYDPQPINGYNYYRLIQVDEDGSKHHSPVVSVDMSSAEKESLRLYPNPAYQNIQVDFLSQFDGEINLEVFDALGQQVLSQHSIGINAGNNPLNLSIANWSKGMYMLRITHGPKTFSARFIKK